MKKNHKTKTLLVAVLIIWGAIGYQIYSRLNPSIPELQALEIQNTFKKQEVKPPPSYDLKTIYRDPFLGTFPKRKKVVTGRKRTKPKEVIPFPEVIYNGIIEGSSSKSYILTVNRKQEILKKGETYEGVKLIRATKNKAVVQFQKQRKIIQKQ